MRASRPFPRMRAHLILAEEISLNPDDTFDVVRGGLSSFRNVDGTAFVRGEMLLTIDHAFHEEGTHELSVRTIDGDGEVVIGGIEGSFETPPAAGGFHIAFRIEGELPTGRFEVHVTIDDELVTSCPIEVVDALGPARAG